jgi:hypothetical protein
MLPLRYFALGMATTMQQYEAEIAPLKRRLFDAAVAPGAEVLELGMGTGPNLRYYGSKVTSAAQLEIHLEIGCRSCPAGNVAEPASYVIHPNRPPVFCRTSK